MGLQVWLPLDGDLRNLGVHNLTLTNTNATISASGKIGQSYSFNGSSAFLQSAAEECELTRDHWSVGCWFYNTKDSTNGHQYMISIHRSSDATNFQFTLCLYGNKLCLRTDGTTRNGPAITLNKWYHGMTVYDGTNLYFYLDGILTTTTTLPAEQDATAATFIVGARLGGTGFFGGQLNDVRIYDHALSAAEVKEIAKGLAMHYKLDNFVNSNVLTNNVNVLTSWVAEGMTREYDDNALKITDEGTGNRRIYNGVQENTYNTAGETFTVSFDARAAADGTVINCSRSIVATDSVDVTLSTDWQHYSKQFTVSATATGGTLSIQSKTTNAVFWIRNVKLEHGACETQFIQPGEASTIEDSSGYDHKAIVYGDILSQNEDIPKYTHYINFPATSAYIRLNDVPTATWTTDGFTIAWYGRQTSALGTMQWGFVNGSNRLNGIYNGNLWNTGDSSNNPIQIPGTSTTVDAFTLNEWHHFAMVYDKTHCLVYKDGELWGQAKTVKIPTGTTIQLNGWQDNGSTYRQENLSMSDFRIYCTPLSADDIKQLYSVPVKIDNYGNVYAMEFVEGERIMQEDGVDISGTNTITLSNATTTGSEQFTIVNWTDQWYTQNSNGSWSVEHSKNSIITKQNNYTTSAGTFPIKNNMQFTITYPAMGSFYPHTYSYAKKNKKSSSPGYTYANPVYGYYGRYRVLLNLYNSDDVLVKIITIKNQVASGSLSSSTVAAPSQAITAGTYNSNTLNLPFEISYGKIEFQRCANRFTDTSNKTITLTNKKEFPEEHHQITIDQQGQLYELEINEVNFDTNAQFKKDGTVLAREFIER